MSERYPTLDQLEASIKRARVRKRKIPLLHECPFCGAEPEDTCRSKAGYATSTHMLRWACVGIKDPTPEEREREYQISMQIALRNTLRLRERIRSGEFSS